MRKKKPKRPPMAMRICENQHCQKEYTPIKGTQKTCSQCIEEQKVLVIERQEKADIKHGGFYSHSRFERMITGYNNYRL